MGIKQSLFNPIWLNSNWKLYKIYWKNTAEHILYKKKFWIWFQSVGVFNLLTPLKQGAYIATLYDTWK